MHTKEELRIKAKKIRQDKRFLPLSDMICQNIKQYDKYISSQTVMIFYPLQYEINLLPLLKDNKNFVFPKIIDDEIKSVLSSGEFETGKFNIQEPLNTNEISPQEIDIVFIPALCVDKNGNRLGYGKGYYDKFIKTLSPKTALIVPIYNDLILNAIPHESFDEKIDTIITENSIIQISDV